MVLLNYWSKALFLKIMLVKDVTFGRNLSFKKDVESILMLENHKLSPLLEQQLSAIFSFINLNCAFSFFPDKPHLMHNYYQVSPNVEFEGDL
jgi:hypothetical protein